MIGVHKLVLRVTAECSSNYFSSIGFELGINTKDDKCVYTVYKNMLIWLPVEISTTSFLIIGIVLFIFAAAVLLWWIFSYYNFKKLKNYLDNYQDLGEEGIESNRDVAKESNLNVEPPISSADK
jgi:hypothetical protein